MFEEVVRSGTGWLRWFRAAVDPSQVQRLMELAGLVSLREREDECARVRTVADPDPAATRTPTP